MTNVADVIDRYWMMGRCARCIVTSDVRRIRWARCMRVGSLRGGIGVSGVGRLDSDVDVVVEWCAERWLGVMSREGESQVIRLNRLNRLSMMKVLCSGHNLRLSTS